MKKKKNRVIGEFKAFITRGNVIDMAVGIIIGTAFTAIVTSLVNDILMPAIGYLINGTDFTQFRWVLKKGVEADASLGIAAVKEVAIYYGRLIQQIINFILIALVVFIIVKTINSLRKRHENKEADIIPEAPIKSELEVLEEIRDLLQIKKAESDDNAVEDK